MFIPHYVSRVMCHVSKYIYINIVFIKNFIPLKKFDKMVEVVAGGSVINGAYPVIKRGHFSTRGPSGNQTFPWCCAPRESLISFGTSPGQIYPDNACSFSTVVPHYINLRCIKTTKLFKVKLKMSCFINTLFCNLWNGRVNYGWQCAKCHEMIWSPK